jgi:predicted nucleic acid-binding protein
MPDKVVDASALAAIAFAEPGADAVLDQIDGHRLHAPTLVVFELMNVAWKRARKQPAASALFLEALEVLEGLGLRFRGINQEEVVRLGLATGLSAYDASYLWLSRALDLPLVTLDRKLGAHAKQDV